MQASAPAAPAAPFEQQRAPPRASPAPQFVNHEQFVQAAMRANPAASTPPHQGTPQRTLDFSQMGQGSPAATPTRRVQPNSASSPTQQTGMQFGTPPRPAAGGPPSREVPILQQPLYCSPLRNTKPLRVMDYTRQATAEAPQTQQPPSRQPVSRAAHTLHMQTPMIPIPTTAPQAAPAGHMSQAANAAHQAGVRYENLQRATPPSIPPPFVGPASHVVPAMAYSQAGVRYPPSSMRMTPLQVQQQIAHSQLPSSSLTPRQLAAVPTTNTQPRPNMSTPMRQNVPMRTASTAPVQFRQQSNLPQQVFDARQHLNIQASQATASQFRPQPVRQPKFASNQIQTAQQVRQPQKIQPPHQATPSKGTGATDLATNHAALRQFYMKEASLRQAIHARKQYMELLANSQLQQRALAQQAPQHGLHAPVVAAQLTPTKIVPHGNSVTTIQSPRQPVPHSGLTAPPTPVRDAAVEQYWNRLQALLKSARTFAAELQPNRSAPSRPSEIPRQIAYDLQGLTSTLADAHAAQQNEQYRNAYQARAAGDFTEYGVTSAHAVWAAHILSEVAGHPAPTLVLTDGSLAGTCPDKAIEEVRLRVFEAEVSCLPVDFVEALLKRRRSMRRFKARIDLCVRILLALEGLGRRPAAASLDRMKLQLEKADIQAQVEAERNRQKYERSKQKQEREKKSVVKTEHSSKRKRQQSAQANFMMRFVKKDEKETLEDEEGPIVKQDRVVAPGFGDTPLSLERDALGVASWLRMEVATPSPCKLDHRFEDEGAEDVIVDGFLRHIGDCAKRRESAEERTSIVLLEYRKQRKRHTDDRTPCYVFRRADIRGRGSSGPVKLLQFSENHRPAYYGTFGRRSRSVSGRTPFKKDSELDYGCDSADEWDEDEEGEDLLDVEADAEMANEEAELRKLYGSDDEEDDDFLDDGGVDDDDNDDDGKGDEENNTTNGLSTAEASSPSKDSGSQVPVIDLTGSPTCETGSDKSQKRPSSDVKKRSGKRRKGMLKQAVVIYGVSIPNGEPSSLDQFAVTSFESSQPIQMFNPFVYTSSDIVAENLKAKPPSTRPARASNMDEPSKLELAVALMRTGLSKDKIVLQFCENRRMRGLTVPAKSDIQRAIGEIATKEKRSGDTRAIWYLTDLSMARKVAEMNKSTSANLPEPHSSTSVLVE